MKIIVILVTLLLPVGAWAQTPEPTATPTPTPTPTATPYMQYPESTTSTVAIPTTATMILPVSKAREFVTVELMSGSSSNVQCSQTDKEVRADVFTIFDSAPPYQLIDPSGPLYCKSRSGAEVEVVTNANPNKAYTKVVKNIGKTSIRVLRYNPLRTRATFFLNNSGGPVYCGYTCPATAATGVAINANVIFQFRDKGEMCCILDSTSDDPADVSISVEFGNS